MQWLLAKEGRAAGNNSPDYFKDNYDLDKSAIDLAELAKSQN